FGQERDDVLELFGAQLIFIAIGHDREVVGGKGRDVGALDGGGFADAFGDLQVLGVAGDQAGEDFAGFQFHAIVDVVGVDGGARGDDVAHDGVGIFVSQIREVGAEVAALIVDGVAGEA